MTRLEKHRKYREEAAASISNNQKSINNFKRGLRRGIRHEVKGNFNNMKTDQSNSQSKVALSHKPVKIEAIDFSKPISRPSEGHLVSQGPRTSSLFHDTPQVQDNNVKMNIDIDALRERAKKHTANELFDIDEAFNQLKKEHASPGIDTQLEVVNNLFSDKLTEYNSKRQLQTPATDSPKMVIDEEKLMSLLDERERKLKQELLAKERQQQKKIMAETEKKLREREKRERAERIRFEKEQARIEKEQAKMGKEMNDIKKESASVASLNVMQSGQPAVSQNALALTKGTEKWAVETKSLQKRVKQHEYEFVNLENNMRKNNAIIIILILVLLGLLGYLIYNFIAV